MRKNKFIAFEGIDGCGKSTQAQLLKKRLVAAGHKVYLTNEPTDSHIGSIIRNIFKGRIAGDHKTIAGLFVADRLDHLQNQTNGILKKLEDGFTVICDRYYLSSYAYQGAHVNLDWVIEANRLSAELLRPDLNIYIDISPEISMERLHQNRNDIEIFENLENLKKVKAAYFKAMELVKNEEQIVSINGDQNMEALADIVWAHICKLIDGQQSG